MFICLLDYSFNLIFLRFLLFSYICFENTVYNSYIFYFPYFVLFSSTLQKIWVFIICGKLLSHFVSRSFKHVSFVEKRESICDLPFINCVSYFSHEMVFPAILVFETDINNRDCKKYNCIDLFICRNSSNELRNNDLIKNAFMTATSFSNQACCRIKKIFLRNFPHTY